MTRHETGAFTAWREERWGRRGGDIQVDWITALRDSVGIPMVRQPCLLIVCFMFSAFQRKMHSIKKHWLWVYSCSSGLYLILQQGTIWGPSNPWDLQKPHNCWYQHEIMLPAISALFQLIYWETEAWLRWMNDLPPRVMN